MKFIYTLMFITAAALLSGCVTGRNSLVLDAVGPAWSQPAEASPPLTNGTLVVYSAYRISADFDESDPRRPEYSDYKIFTTDGKLLRKVHNKSGTILQDVVKVELSPGKYNVVARANGYGYVTVPVMIAPQQSTILHLEGDSWSDQSVFNQTNAVRLPDGLIVGWKAAPNLESAK
jgi:hypothetical protein